MTKDTKRKTKAVEINTNRILRLEVVKSRDVTTIMSIKVSRDVCTCGDVLSVIQDIKRKQLIRCEAQVTHNISHEDYEIETFRTETL